MLSLTKRLGRKIANALIIIEVCTAACSWAQVQNNRSAVGSPEAAAASFWQTIAKSCPVQGESTPSLFLRWNGDPGSLIEYRESIKRLSPPKLTKADELNGIRYKGYAGFSGAAFRTFDPSNGGWSKWQTGAPVGALINKLADDSHPEGGWPFYWIFSMENTNDRWTFRLTNRDRFVSDRVKDVFYHLLLGEPLNLAALSGAAPQLSCAELTSQNPGGAMRPKPKGDALEDNLSDLLSVSEVRPFVEMLEQDGFHLRSHISEAYSVAWLKDNLDTRAGWLESPPTWFHFEFIPAGTRYKAVIYDGVPLMFRNATVVQLESGRVGLLGKSLK